ncbi:hypothetical protein L226DRAFT_369602 [Lentinus tigrinus ALCF2SS1-7]|uniref:uncharacterized protein n=1 Tax=Lentinus tigrinus ALCF2SS1-7 TaxID=1328758 RepID=UPI001165E437|nr:hypothetical protein L226DRAFT_369602 [Lentinus tigrinus ALCF2SS1-7]
MAVHEVHMSAFVERALPMDDALFYLTYDDGITTHRSFEASRVPRRFCVYRCRRRNQSEDEGVASSSASGTALETLRNGHPREDRPLPREFNSLGRLCHEVFSSTPISILDYQRYPPVTDLGLLLQLAHSFRNACTSILLPWQSDACHRSCALSMNSCSMMIAQTTEDSRVQD